MSSVNPDGPAADEERPVPDQAASSDEADGAPLGDDATAGTPKGEEPGGRDPRRFNEWRKRSATGVVMSGIALGLREALELPDQRPAIVAEAPGDPTDPDRPIELHFDPDDPAATVAVVRHQGALDRGTDGGASDS